MLGLNPYHSDTLRQEQIRFPAPLETDSMLEENPFPPSLEEFGPPPMKKPRGNNELEYHHNAEVNVVGLESDSMKNSQGSNELGDDGRRIMLFDDLVLVLAENERQHAISYGFDVPLSGGFPVVEYRKGINSVDDYLYHAACYCAKFAINPHNKCEEESELEFESLVKFDLEKLAGSMVYYLTFKAIDVNCSIDTYRAKVAFSESKGDRKAKVLLFSGKFGTYVPSKEHGTDLMQEENPDALSEEEVGSLPVRKSCGGNCEHHPEFLDINDIRIFENGAFQRKFYDSDGFDADYPPHGFLIGEGLVIVKDLASIRKLGEYLRHKAYYCAKTAVDEHNKDADQKKKKLEFVELVKFNLDDMDANVPEYYYLTFEAREVGDGGKIDTYQARVAFEENDGEREAEVRLFRKKK